jgi:hypothetical protein
MDNTLGVRGGQGRCDLLDDVDHGRGAQATKTTDATIKILAWLGDRSGA